MVRGVTVQGISAFPDMEYDRKGDGQLTIREMDTLEAKDLQWESRALNYFSAWAKGAQLNWDNLLFCAYIFSPTKATIVKVRERKVERKSSSMQHLKVLILSKL